jgi:hypothetical protein
MGGNLAKELEKAKEKQINELDLRNQKYLIVVFLPPYGYY